MDRTERSGGGVAIVIRRSIQHRLLGSIRTHLVENLGIGITLGSENILNIFGFYFSGGTSGIAK